MDEWVGGWLAGWLAGWMDGRMDGWNVTSTSGIGGWIRVPLDSVLESMCERVDVDVRG